MSPVSPAGIVALTKMERDALSLAVARVIGLVPINNQPAGFFFWEDPVQGPVSGFFSPADDWEHGGPLVDKALLEFTIRGKGHVEARYPGGAGFHGETHLVAAMRCIEADARSVAAFQIR